MSRSRYRTVLQQSRSKHRTVRKNALRLPAKRAGRNTISLLLATLVALLFALTRDDLAQHHHTVAVHESNAGKALAMLEADLRHLVRLQGMGVLHLLAASLLAHFPLQGGDAACGAAATHETNRGIACLDFIRDVQDLNLRIELTSLAQGSVFLIHHHVTRAGHVLLIQALDVQAHVVAWVGEVDPHVMHLNREHFANARIRSGVRGQEDDLLTWLHHTRLHSACKHVSDTLDLVNARNRHAHGGADRALRHTAELVQHIVHGVDVNRLLAVVHINSLPPRHLLRLLQEVVTHPAGDRNHRGVFVNEILLPANLNQHVFHLVGDLVEASLLVPCRVAVHLVHTDHDLLHTQQVDQTRVLARLTLNLACLVIALGNRSREIAIGWHHDTCHVGLRCTSDHVLDEVTMAWGIDDRVVPLLSVELLRRARDRHAALTLLLLTVHEERKGEGPLAESLGLRLQLLQLSFRQAAKLENQAASSGALSTVDMTTDHNGKVLLLGIGWHGFARFQGETNSKTYPRWRPH